MVAPHGAIRATVPVTQEVTGCFWRLLRDPGDHSAIPGIIWACSHRDCLLGAAPAEVAALGLLLLRSLTQVYSHRCSWLGPAPAEVLGLGPVLKRSLAWACSLNLCSLVPVPGEVTALEEHSFLTSEPSLSSFRLISNRK